MVSTPKPIPVTAETDLLSLLDDAAQGPVLLERDGTLFRLVREDHDMAYEPDAERVRRILDETVGGWADLDIDAIIAEIHEARRAGSRPPDRP